MYEEAMIIVQIAGRLGRDAETRFTPSGQKVTTLTVATNVRKGGKDETVWWRVTIWGERYDKMMPYLKKGSAVVVVGEMNKPEIWTDKEGRPQVSLELTAEIVRFSPFGNSERSQDTASHGASGVSQSQASYGDDSSFGDFNSGSYQSAAHGQGGGRYSQTAQNDDPLPF
jgi:single-strand DNA-binding protein